MSKSTKAVIVRNVGSQRYVWPFLSRPDGRTLELEAGEEALLTDDPGEHSHLSIRPVTPTAPLEAIEQ